MELLAADLPVFLLIDLLEQWALVPRDALVTSQRSGQVLLRHVKHPDFEPLVRFGVCNQVLQPAPRGLQRLKVRLMDDFVDLLGQLAVDLGNDRLDRAQ